MLEIQKLSNTKAEIYQSNITKFDFVSNFIVWISILIQNIYPGSYFGVCVLFSVFG